MGDVGRIGGGRTDQHEYDACGDVLHLRVADAGEAAPDGGDAEGSRAGLRRVGRAHRVPCSSTPASSSNEIEPCGSHPDQRIPAAGMEHLLA